MTASSDEFVLVLARRRVGSWKGEVALLGHKGAWIRLCCSRKADQCLAIHAHDLCHALAAMQLAGHGLDTRFGRLNGLRAAIDHRPLPATATDLFTFATLNEAGVVTSIVFQAGRLEGGTIAPLRGGADHITLAPAHVLALTELAGVAAGEIKAGAAVARLMIGFSAANAKGGCRSG
jgi:hypothetical protein